MSQAQLDLQTQMNHSEIQQNIQELQQALLTQHPEMPSLLRKIHAKLKADPAVVTLLTEEEIASVISGLKVQTNVSFSANTKKPAAKKTTATSRLNDILKSSGVTADDF